MLLEAHCNLQTDVHGRKKKERKKKNNTYIIFYQALNISTLQISI